jgi:hypothetical protein
VSPELESLDQLLGGDTSLATIRGIFADDQALQRAVYALLKAGEVRLVTRDQVTVPSWRWRELFVDGNITHELLAFRLQITVQGASRVS